MQVQIESVHFHPRPSWWDKRKDRKRHERRRKLDKAQEEREEQILSGSCLSRQPRARKSSQGLIHRQASQSQSPLFERLPLEVRRMIYVYAASQNILLSLHDHRDFGDLCGKRPAVHWHHAVAGEFDTSLYWKDPQNRTKFWPAIGEKGTPNLLALMLTCRRM